MFILVSREKNKKIDMLIKSVYDKARATSFGKLFLDKRFFNYVWVGILISTVNVFLLWLFIDVWHMGTVISGVIVVAGTFIFRYVLLIFYKIF